MQRFFIFAAEMYGFERFWTVLYEFVRNGTFLNFFSARMIKGEFALLPIEISSCKGKDGSLTIYRPCSWKLCREMDCIKRQCMGA